MSDISGLKAKLKADVISAVQGEVAEAAKKQCVKLSTPPCMQVAEELTMIELEIFYKL